MEDSFGISFLLLMLFLLMLPPLSLAQLRVGFYNSSCPDAESTIREAVGARFARDPTVSAALLRMHFHDCFVRGCDASLLIDSTRSRPSEKSAGPNLSVRGYELIDEIKTQLEDQCPSTVSCADIVALATRDAVALVGGPTYTLPTGRRDGLMSKASEVILPGPSDTVSRAFPSFRDKGLNLFDMVVLLGAHTLGVTHCGFVRHRLSDFQGTGQPDPSMDPALVSNLSRTCAVDGDPSLFLDQKTPLLFDNEFYKELRKKRGLLELDQRLSTDRATRGAVSVLAGDDARFKRMFAASMVKLGSVNVLTGEDGEIRLNCRRFN